MKVKPHQLIESPEFKKLVRARWTVSFILLSVLFINYYGFILTIAFKKDWLTERLGQFANYGLIVGALVIVVSWLLTIVYVYWANTSYDKDTEHLKGKLEKGSEI
ncbi:PF04341 family protein [Leptospira inadai serovar Lyme str. 10]|uniref:PF04341 family protein n=2 Tax=Leptospira inadai serovar Lyme TaxID=293084 RepID=V6HEM7_9LEPT|nr:DUF485 domain-containing protein [Leptospira inadai]EQA38567.1 PF04341 family protein [Leptospira inadai serovar Lyme str. 10]PNV74265.1 DUF485 domain-containing protein [Leptospira inadai serovar Lyme]